MRRFELGAKQTAQITKVFDADGTGSVDYNEFVAFCTTKDVDEAVRISKSVKKKRRK